MKYKILIAVLSLFAVPSFATGLEYIGRCDLASPTVPIAISADPRNLVTCARHDRGTYLRMSQKVHVSIGAQTYPLRDEWLVYGESCADAVKTFREFPELQALDPESNTSLMLILDREYKSLVVAFGLRRDACRAKAKVPSDLDTI